MSETKFTPGPWRWELDRKGKRVQLCGGDPRFDLTVMDFVRWGLGGAQPRLLQRESDAPMLLENAPTFGKNVPGRDHHADWFQTIDHPDAHLIAAAPKMYAALEDARLKLTGALAMLQSEQAGLLDSVNYDGSGETDSDGLSADIQNAIGQADIALAEARGER